MASPLLGSASGEARKFYKLRRRWYATTVSNVLERT